VPLYVLKGCLIRGKIVGSGAFVITGCGVFVNNFPVKDLFSCAKTLIVVRKIKAAHNAGGKIVFPDMVLVLK